MLPQSVKVVITKSDNSNGRLVFVEDTANTVQASVISRLYYCNALWHGITDELMHCLQSV